MDEPKDKRPLIVIVVAIALAVCLFIPYSHWDTGHRERTAGERGNDCRAQR